MWVAITAVTRLALLPRAPSLTAFLMLVFGFPCPCPCPRSGDIYRRHALAKLRAGSEDGFKTYALNPSLSTTEREGTLKVPAGDVVYFDKCAELAGSAATHLPLATASSAAAMKASALSAPTSRRAAAAAAASEVNAVANSSDSNSSWCRS